ncbi:MAG: hypothetical protein KF810_01055 [Rhizobiaceae bacterium]|nr:hypothetical protein [Rhizobiaceae bacterium]
MGKLSRIVLLAGAVTAPFSVARAEMPSARATIGDITFNYSPEAWRIESSGDGLIATCVQEDCRGAVVDISRRDRESGCTKEAMGAEAARLFPVEDRFYENAIPLGRFALALAIRHAGPDLSSPEYAYGCLAWQGDEYRFAMRPETVGNQSSIGGALIYLVSRATAPEAPVPQLRVGEVTFKEPGLKAVLSVHPADTPCPSAPIGSENDDGGAPKLGTIQKERPDGLDFITAEFWLGCRNYVPPRFAACTVHNGRSYHLSTSGASSCRSSTSNVSQDVLVDLLKSARVAE